MRNGSVFILGWLVVGLANGEDWPTYRHDAARAGGTDEVLAVPLFHHWTRDAAATPQPAWEGPRETPIEGKVMKHRVTFDDAHQVAVSGKRLYYGSIVDHHLYCVDAVGGRTLWTFATEGPIRLAPTLAGDRVYFGSDDGCVYCLEATTGKLVWRHRAGPRDERLLARGEMISRWPIRTGVLVEENVAYFGAGIFPHETVYLIAVDATSGEPIWKNDRISQRDAGRDDLSPQGYLLANQDMLFVPSGRTLPAAFDKATGKYEYKRTFGWRNTAGGVVGGAQAVLADGQLFSFGAHHMLALDQATGDAGYAYLNGRQLVLRKEKAFIANGKEVIAVDRQRHAEASRQRQALFVARRAVRNDPKKLDEINRQMAAHAETGVLWRAAFAGDAALIRTANLVIAGGNGGVTAWNLETGQQVWTTELAGEARGLAVANGGLYVSTTTGAIHCFRAGRRATATRVAASSSDAPYRDDADGRRFADAAHQILQQSSADRGFCLVLGAGDGRLAYELARNSRLRIYAVEENLQQVAMARERLRRAGLYGRRIVLFHSDLSGTALANYFANLVVSQQMFQSGSLPRSAAELGRYVKPCGGVVCLAAPQTKTAEQLATTLRETYLRDDAEISTTGDWAVLRRGKLSGVGDWSHQYGNVGNTSFSRDYRVKGSLGVLWYGDPGPSQMINRHEAASAPLTTNGRFFVQGEDNVRAYDAYNGTFLWTYQNPGAIRTGVFNNNETSNLAASDDALYVVAGDTCTELDAATGAVKARYRSPQADDGVPRSWGFVAVHDGVLYGTSTIRSELAQALRRRGRTVGASTDAIFAVDLSTQKRAWTYRAKNIMHVTIAMSDQRMFFVESTISQEEREALLRQDKSELRKLKGEAAKRKAEELKQLDVRRAVCLDRKSGEQVWSQPIDVTNVSGISAGGGNICLMYHDNLVVICGANANGHYWNQFLSGKFSQRRILVLNAADGKKRWSKDANYMNRPVIVEDQIIAEPWSFQIATGKERTRVHPITGEESPWQFSRPGHHCGIITATPNMMLFRSGFIGYYDLYSDSGTRHFAGQRLGCWVNAIPGNGLVVIPEASAGCVCLFSITSTVVLEPREDRDPAWGIYSAAGPSTPVKRLAVNLGAPGDRRDSLGTLWLSYPRPRTRGRMEYVFDLKPTLAKGGGYYAEHHESVEIKEAVTPWVLSSGARGLTRFELPLLGKDDPPSRYTIKLHFAELDPHPAGERVFDIQLQGAVVERGLDITAEVGRGAALVRTFRGIEVNGRLQVELVPRGTQPPLLCGVEVISEDDTAAP